MITDFSDEYAFLSNFYMCSVFAGGYAWPSAEHAFQAQKTLNPEAREAIARARYPGQAKGLGRRLTLRPDWEAIKKRVMFEVVLAKFDQHDNLAQRLVATGFEELIEGNSWGDTYWGAICSPSHPCTYFGMNQLGRTLMFVRDLLRED